MPRDDQPTEWGGYAGDNRRNPRGVTRPGKNPENASDLRRMGIRDADGPFRGEAPSDGSTRLSR